MMLLLFCCNSALNAQSCPPNIDFENGTFSGWTCYTGVTSAGGGQNTITLNPSSGPVANKHTMYTSNTGEVDPYGGFPVSCPNGSKHSIKLGSTEAGGQAEGISYEFTIPSNENFYSIIYHYAVVFQSPNHQVYEQPRMEIEVMNMTDNSLISCASFTFIAVGSSLPGFKLASVTDTIDVLYKEWSAASVDLSGMAGKRIRLFFKTADCTFRRHFGYAYVDVNTECTGSFTGATYCPDDTVVNIIAPYGYKGYTWFDSSLSNILGTQQQLTMAPPPVSGTTFAVRLDPYQGYGCQNTLFTTVKDSLTVIAAAGADALSCNLEGIPLGIIPKPGLIYSWSPATGLSDPNVANPVATPSVTTNYIVATSNSGGGCKTTDTVQVRASVIDDSLQVLGKTAYCFGYGDSAVLVVHPAALIEWFKDGVPINGVTNQPKYKVLQQGNYAARITNSDGCSLTTKTQNIIVEHERAGITYPVLYAIINLPLNLNARKIGETALWNPAINLNNPASFTPVYKGLFEQLYTVKLTTVAGCITVDTQLVKTVKQVEIYVPTAFTPNIDGKNDVLRPMVRGIKEVRYFRIFNRWGELLFQNNDPAHGWDGIYKGVAQPTQTVVWMLQCIGLDGVFYEKKGTSILLR